MKNILYQMAKLGDTSRFKAVKRILLTMFVFCCVVIFYTMPSISAKSEKIMIFFYSSETNINNFKSLKMEFDSYLSKSGSYKIQPFNDRKAFEQHIRDKKNCLLFLSSWHYSKIYKEYSLKPCLVGIRNNKKYQKRILMSSAKYANLKTAMKGPVASASNEAHTRSVLTEMIKNKKLADSVRVLTVPKDIDALMSVGFKMSKCALTTENAADNLKMTDPKLYEKMRILAEGKESLLLIVAAPENFTKDAKKLIKIIKNMPGDPDGINIIKMLDLDGWKPVDPSDISKLEGLK
ncbi:PhnD/SsuA/transferrin family substrate-binding protein [Desulfonema magnum]|uniref:Uncharacterized protein n=1 Tax=Desulfonema magnum TaxID=45655 RepID=A0A975GRY3_9BACT|nr:PhnD/SsuA/transferrin family substrate-binding protein [Desulfonema magnum]QTA91529.1 Uncharacterized protein dnm_075980 [Desulfonema magnum]